MRNQDRQKINSEYYLNDRYAQINKNMSLIFKIYNEKKYLKHNYIGVKKMMKFHKIEVIDYKIIISFKPPTRNLLTSKATQQTRKVVTHKKIKVKGKDIRQRNLATWLYQ